MLITGVTKYRCQHDFDVFICCINLVRTKVFATFRQTVGTPRQRCTVVTKTQGTSLVSNNANMKVWKNKGWWHRHHTRILVKTIGITVIFLYIVFPVWFYFCPWIRRQAVFLNNLNWPRHTYLSDPQNFELNCTRQFFVESEPGIQLGVWHILPKSLSNDCIKQKREEDHFADDRPVILYLHGNAQNRAAKYRLQMYKVLTESKVDAHVVTFDYRGFGDSSFVSPTAAGLVQDARAMYQWLKQRVKRHRIFLWGHSLGTGVVIQLGRELAKANDNPVAIILEAPFTSIVDATHTFPLSFLHRHMPFFQTYCSEPTRHKDTNFDSESLIGSLTTPLLFLHAGDDMMVFVELGRKLYQRAIKDLPEHVRRPEFIEFDRSLGYGHRNINRDPNLPDIVVRFMQSVSIKSHAS